MQDFSGTKIALLYKGELVMYQRDEKPGLRFAGMWDFFGGGREGEETVHECAIREIEEELCITLPEASFIWEKEYSAMHDSNQRAYFLVAELNNEQFEALQFGSEGQCFGRMGIAEFLKREDVVPHLKVRLQDYLATR